MLIFDQVNYDYRQGSLCSASLASGFIPVNS